MVEQRKVGVEMQKVQHQHWKQDNPRQQLVASAQSIDGWVLNLEELYQKIQSTKNPTERFLYQASLIRSLGKALPSMKLSIEDIKDLGSWMGEDWNNKT